MSLSITNSLTLRVYYNNYNSLVKTSNRKDATTGTLSMADASALRNAVRKLQDFDFEEASESQVQEKLKAFADTINYTISSAQKYGSNNTAVKNAANNIKNLNAQYESELKKIGISIDSDGTLSVYDSAAKNFKRERFTKFFDKENQYLNDLYTNARKITRKVDVRI
ncbi:hypothetical protein [Pseudobutyrivibrio sp.]|uniref:hypothetical protein n=1 Tax=Pseudobutyrivibrio sp. TaxID=2014367 RepID=UPI001D52D58D|nr:hypothetical protein [Pseudobutyrivibrio sp.]MBE5911056.1 hypothetical protein [Pseudobutyrivibrio sp.]